MRRSLAWLGADPVPRSPAPFFLNPGPLQHARADHKPAPWPRDAEREKHSGPGSGGQTNTDNEHTQPGSQGGSHMLWV